MVLFAAAMAMALGVPVAGLFGSEIVPVAAEFRYIEE